MISALLSFLVWACIVAVVVYVVRLLLDMLPIPPTVKQIIYIILGLVLLLEIIQHFALFSSGVTL